MSYCQMQQNEEGTSVKCNKIGMGDASGLVKGFSPGPTLK